MLGNAITTGVAVVSGAAALAGVAVHHTMTPTTQWYGKTFFGLSPGTKQIALTYDDGPNDPYTLRLVEMLARHDVRATFFMIGRYVKQRPEIARAVAEAGHVVANHTFNHPLLIFKGNSSVEKELESCKQVLLDAAGPHSNLFRPPFGGLRPGLLSFIRKSGLEPIMWNVTGFDWDAPPVEFIEEKVAGQMRGGDIILLHDGGHAQMGADRGPTIAASERMIRRYRGEGYEFVTVSQMLEQSQAKTPGAAVLQIP
ncbi:MAG TPA: polysaccharide deacetylase family protein [Terriglobales bacterium]|nr:polysaccharide deacetylase family protein [Terriglobales bacterium]